MTTTTNMNVNDAGKVFVDPTAYAEEDRFHQAAALLRRASPVHWVDEQGYRPFWAITRHADVMEIERDNYRFLSAPRPLLARNSTLSPITGRRGLRQTIIANRHPIDG